MSLSQWRARRADRWADDELTDRLVWAFRQACIGAAVCLAVDAPVAGTMYRTPEVTHLELGPPLRLTVRMLEGQVPAQLQKAGPLIAPHLGGVALRVVDRGFGWALVTVLAVDPLAAVLPIALPRPDGRVWLGRDEAGQDVTVSPGDLPHVIAQGQTGGGKSIWLYAVLAQLAARDDVLVAGVDPSGITLRPFADTRHAAWQAVGLASLDAVEKTLSDLVAEMDTRLATMPRACDVLPTGPGTPLVVVVLEEWPATLRALDYADAKQGKRVRGLVARLLAESRKVGFRIVLAAQRAEAAIVGAAERAQCAGRLSFRLDSIDSIKLLHSDADDYAAAHTVAPPGVALLTWPGRPLARIRAPFLDYAAFCAAVAATP